MKPAVIVVIIAVIVLLGIGAYMMMSKKPTMSSDSITIDDTTEMQGITGTPATKMVPNANSTFTGKLTDLFTRSESQQCILKGEAGKSINGTYFISNGRVRTEMTVADTGMQMNMLIKDGTMYYWTDKPTPFGFKMSLTQMQAQTSTAPSNPSTSQATDLVTKDQVFDCTSWALDETKFEVPTNITFSSMAH